MTRVGINGFGRLGRLVVRGLSHHPELELVHVDDPRADTTTAAHLLQFDSGHGRYDGEVVEDGVALTIDGVRVTHTSCDTPGAIPRADHGVGDAFRMAGLAAKVAAAL